MRASIDSIPCLCVFEHAYFARRPRLDSVAVRKREVSWRIEAYVKRIKNTGRFFGQLAKGKVWMASRVSARTWRPSM